MPLSLLFVASRGQRLLAALVGLQPQLVLVLRETLQRPAPPPHALPSPGRSGHRPPTCFPVRRGPNAAFHRTLCMTCRANCVPCLVYTLVTCKVIRSAGVTGGARWSAYRWVWLRDKSCDVDLAVKLYCGSRGSTFLR